MLLTAAPPALGGGCVAIAGHGRCVPSRLACGQMLLTAAPRPLGAGVLRVWATGTVFRHGWPVAKCFSKQRPGPWGRVCFRRGPVALCFVTVGLWPNVPHSSAPGPWGRVCFGYGPRALRFVTVGLRPNVPHSSAPALGGGCTSGAGQWRCVSSRLACGQMFLTAASPPALEGGCASGAGQWHCVSSRLACGQMFLTAAPPAHSTRISKQIFHKEYSQC